jgi:proline dehydrogenase
MKWLNKAILTMMPLIPKFFVGMVAKKYIAGVTLEEAVAKVKILNQQGFVFTMDVLGESVTKKEETLEPLRMYLEVLEAIHKEKLDGNISLKLTQFGLTIDPEFCWNNIKTILDKAKEYNIFVRIDMEDSSVTDATLDIYRRAKAYYSNIGTVIQGYLHRSADDVQKLVKEGVNLRICKGIYKESYNIAFQDRSEIRDNTINLIRYLLNNNQYVAIASHDLQIINEVRQYIESKNIPKDRYEFQSLLGVPIDNTLKDLLANGYKVRYYIPFGTEWYAYSTRRLYENPDLGGYIFKDFFKFWQS